MSGLQKYDKKVHEDMVATPVEGDPCPEARSKHSTKLLVFTTLALREVGVRRENLPLLRQMSVEINHHFGPALLWFRKASLEVTFASW